MAMRSDEVELKAIRYRKSERKSGFNDRSHANEPFRFLWTHSGERADDKIDIVKSSRRMDLIHQRSQGKKVLGTVLVVQDISLPGFGTIYQDTDSNFILHSDNITRVLKIPYFPKPTQTKVLSPNSWYIDAIFWTFYIFNLMNLIFSIIGLLYFVQDTYYFCFYFTTHLNILKVYLAVFFFMIMSVSFIFAVGHSLSGTQSLAFIYLYIFLVMVGNCVMVLFQSYSNFKEKLHWKFRKELQQMFLTGPDLESINRLQTTLGCCGVEHPCDWELLGYEYLPRSCCVTHEVSSEEMDIFNCTFHEAHTMPCTNASFLIYDKAILCHNYMLQGKIFIEWLTIIMAVLYAIAVYNGAMEQKNNVNYKSEVPVEYFNIVTKGEVEFFLPLNYYTEASTQDYKYMILLNDIRRAVNKRQMRFFHQRRYMFFDVV